jgi:hypothetical protein
MSKLLSRSIWWIIFLLSGLGIVALLSPLPPETRAGIAKVAIEEAHEAAGEGAEIEAYFQYRFDQMKDKSGTVPDGALIKALNARESLAQIGITTPHVAGIDSSSWTAVGPGNVGGRIRAILPIDANTVYVAGVAGGIWKTTNCCTTATTWTALDDFLANLAVVTLIADPTNPDILYAGTGEGFSNADAVRGAGVFKSTDGGTTWTQLASTNNSSWYYVNRLAISPDGATLLAATGAGVYRSVDGGVTWSQRLGFSAGFKDVRFDPTDSTKAITSARAQYTYYSTNGGLNWTVATGLPATTARVELAYAPSNPLVVYAGVNQNSGELWKSTDGGQSYVQMNTGTSYMSGQGWYNNMIWVDPTNANHVVVAGLDVYRSTDGGTTLTKISAWARSWGYVDPPSPHADHHIIVSVPPGSGTAVINGNDGGLYYTSDINTAGNNPPNYNNGWVYLNNNLGITQFYGLAGNATSGVLYGGTQDNGTVVYSPVNGANAWDYSDGGDGGAAVADPTDPNYFYGEYIYAQVYRSSNGGVSGDYIYGEYWNGSQWTCRAAPYRLDDACNSLASFIAPFVLDPNNADRLVVGARSLWVTNDAKTPYVWNSPTGGPQWTAIKPSIGAVNITAVAVAPGNSDIIWVGYANGRIDMTIDGGNNWAQVDTNIGVNHPGTRVGRLAIDQNDNNVIYAGFTGFGANRVWRTANGGVSWTNITNNLPQAPVYALAINPTNSDWLYVGTEVGIFASTDTGATWNVPPGPINGDGPANVATFDLQWLGGDNSTGTNTLLAATHGRGAFSVDTGIVWDGGGADNNWSTAANWSRDVVPTANDRVIFNTTSTKHSLIDAGFAGVVSDVLIQPGYTGVITATRSWQVSNTYVQFDGTVVVADPTVALLTVGREVVHEGGELKQSRAVGAGVTVPFLQIEDGIGNVRYRGVELTTDALTDLGVVTVTIQAADYNAGRYCTDTGSSSPVYADRCYNITAATNGPALVRLWALNSALNAIPEANLSVYHGAGGWTELVANRVAGNDGGDYSYAEGQTPGFSAFLLAQAGNTPTVITLQGFGHSLRQPVVWLGLLLLLVGVTIGVVRMRPRFPSRAFPK